MEIFTITKNYIANNIIVSKYACTKDDNIKFFRFCKTECKPNCNYSDQKNNFIPESVKRGFMAIVKNIYDGIVIETNDENITVLTHDVNNSILEYTMYSIINTCKNYNIYPLLSEKNIYNYNDIQNIVKIIRNTEYNLHYKFLQSKIKKIKNTIETIDNTINNIKSKNNKTNIIQNMIYYLKSEYDLIT